MNRIHKQRILFVIFISICLWGALWLVVYALKNNADLFLTPTEVVTRNFPPAHQFRLGGVVKAGSVKRGADGLSHHFIVTDFKHELAVDYYGVLPDLFREAKGVIAEGKLSSQHYFIAAAVLAKHDENYTPKKIADTLSSNKLQNR